MQFKRWCMQDVLTYKRQDEAKAPRSIRRTKRIKDTRPLESIVTKQQLAWEVELELLHVKIKSFWVGIASSTRMCRVLVHHKGIAHVFFTRSTVRRTMASTDTWFEVEKFNGTENLGLWQIWVKDCWHNRDACRRCGKSC